MPHLTSRATRAAVGQDAASAHVLAAAEDFDALLLLCQVRDVGALSEVREEAAVEHEELVGGLVHAGSGGAERVTLAPECCKL